MSVIKNIYFKQADFVLDIPQMKLNDTSVTALVGPSGSGKSTFLRVLLGVEELESWSWELGGVNIAKLSVEERDFGVVFQSLELFPHLSAKENILFPLRCRNELNQEFSSRVEQLAQRLQIEEHLDRKPSQLSGGEKQRVALARALSFKPRFLFLDEPFSSLDEETRENSRRLVKEVLDEYEVPALLVSHDRSDIEALATKVYQIRNGQLI